MKQWSNVYAQNEGFWSVFADSERTAIEAVGAAIDQLRDQALSQSLHIEQVVLLPAWSRVETEAQHALATVAAA